MSIKKLQLSLGLVLLFIFNGFTQTQTIHGVVRDVDNGEPLIAATVIVQGAREHAITDIDGKFSIKTSAEFPLILTCNYLGYRDEEVEVEDPEENILIVLYPSADLMGGLVEVTAKRVKVKKITSPHTIESLDAKAIKETSSSDFYDALAALKGVDVTSASMGFKIVNARGFNSTAPIRSLQLIDGIDNQMPGLNFAVGNFAGSSELDVDRVDYLIGAGSAQYGPNAFNGVIQISTKDPFEHQGLAVRLKNGERNLYEGVVRYAKAFKLGAKEDRLAFKLNFSYMQANDWQAQNYAPTDQSLNRGVDETNFGSYDAVNIYGDERQNVGENNFTGLFGRRNYPGLNIYHRTGYLENDLMDYGNHNMKFSTELHYMLGKDMRIQYGYTNTIGTTVLQRENWVSLNDFRFIQHHLEFEKKDKFKILAYETKEHSGNSYDAIFTALKLQEAFKDNINWSNDYNTYWISNVRQKIWDLPGYPDPNDPQYFAGWFGDDPPNYALSDQIMAMFPDSLAEWHRQAREYADRVNPSFGTSGRLVPGTPEYEAAFDSLTSSSIADGGTQFYSRSKLRHIQGQYHVPIKNGKLLVGTSFRQYLPDSKGTYLVDTAGIQIRNNEWGGFASYEKGFLDENLILSLSGRFDKNQNFNLLFSPAASLVYQTQKNATLRFAFNSAIRNPSLVDQYRYHNVGKAILSGNIDGFENLVTNESLVDYYAELNLDTLRYFNVNPIRPEQIQTVELGYKSKYFEDRLFIDINYYFSWYHHFIGYRYGGKIKFKENLDLIDAVQFYRISANASKSVSTQGFAVGASYFYKKFNFTGNYSWNLLNTSKKEDIIPAFNSPEHKFNVGLSGRDIALFNGKLPHFGFAIDYRWQEGHLFEGSPEFTGFIDAYGLLNVQINYWFEKAHTTVKLGASNILNNKHYELYGGPEVGRMAYISMLFDLQESK